MIEHSVLVLEFFHDAFIEGVFGNDVVVKTGLVLSDAVRPVWETNCQSYLFCWINKKSLTGPRTEELKKVSTSVHRKRCSGTL